MMHNSMNGPTADAAARRDHESRLYQRLDRAHDALDMIFGAMVCGDYDTALRIARQEQAGREGVK